MGVSSSKSTVASASDAPLSRHRARRAVLRGLACAAVMLAFIAPAQAQRGPRASTSAEARRACGVESARSISRSVLPLAPAATFDSVWTIIGRTYWDTTFGGLSWTGVRDELRPQAIAARSPEELREVLGTLLARLGQSHFEIIPGETADGFAGDGSRPVVVENASVGLTQRLIDGRIVVTAVRPGGPAARAGVHPGWIIDRVDACDVAARVAALPASHDPRKTALHAYFAVNALLRGAADSPVVVRFLDDRDAPVSQTIIRAEEPGTIVKFGNLPAMLASLSSERRAVRGVPVGVIRYNVWMTAIAEPFDRAVDSLRDAAGIVIDLRGNVGGVAAMVMGTAGHFIDSIAPLGVMKMRGQELRFASNPRRVTRDARRVTPFAGPVAIITDEGSASTSEFFAGAMQRLGRARVFGAVSAGQALPAVAERLPNGDVLYHAIADFTMTDGSRLEGTGVRPDEPVATTRAALLAGHDPALDAALRWIVAQHPSTRTSASARASSSAR